MKITKKITPTSLKLRRTGSLIALLLIAATFNAHSMKRRLESDNNQNISSGVKQIGDFLLGSTELNPVEQIILSLTNLPPEDASHIAGFLITNKNAQTLEDAAYTIKSLSLTTKELNEMINNPEFCLKLIKYLAQKFNCYDQQIAEALNIPEAQRRLELQNELLKAIVNNNNAMIIKLCQADIDLNFTYFLRLPETEPKGCTALMYAISTGNCDIIQLLVDNGAHINQTDNAGITALILSVVYGKFEVTKCLLNNPTIVINQQDIHGGTALMYAAEKNNCDMIQLLLDKGADINKANSGGGTVLGYAAIKGNTDAVQCLLKNPAIAMKGAK